MRVLLDENFPLIDQHTSKVEELGVEGILAVAERVLLHVAKR